MESVIVWMANIMDIQKVICLLKLNEGDRKAILDMNVKQRPEIDRATSISIVSDDRLQIFFFFI